MTANTKTPAAEPDATPTEAKERAACLCGCGGFPSKFSSRFLPGHDARYHAALKRAAKEQVEVEAPAKPKARRGKTAV